MFERDLTNITRLLDNPVPQRQLGVGRWGPEGEVTRMSDELIDAVETAAEETEPAAIGDEADDFTNDAAGE